MNAIPQKAESLTPLLRTIPSIQVSPKKAGIAANKVVWTRFITRPGIPKQTSFPSLQKGLSFSNRALFSQSLGQKKNITTMATPKNISVSKDDSGIFNWNVKAESALKVSQVLQEDMEKHHIFFNDEGFHNHTAHHVLSAFALGASPEDIQRAYDSAAGYQRPAIPVDESIVKKLSNKEEFGKLAGKRDQYSNFLAFFQREIEAKGVSTVIQEYVFAGDEFADDMLLRLFGGLLHPFIHLGFGLEFNQPAIVAQGLAQTAVHESYFRPFLMAAEQAAGGIGGKGIMSLVKIQNELLEDDDILNSTRWSDVNKIFDGILKRSPDKMIKYASQFKVGPDQIDEKLLELINFAVFYTGAAQNPPKLVKFDFFHMHCVNSSIFLPTFLSQSWLSEKNKMRLLEWKGRVDLLVYVSRGCAKSRVDEIKNYDTAKPWEDIFSRVIAHKRDDGHAVKLIRLLAYAEKVSKPFENKDGCMISGDMWLRLGNMAIDSVSDPGQEYVRSAGFPEAWENIAERARL